MVKSVFDRTPHKFIPNGIVEELVTEKAIRKSLYPRHANPNDEAKALIRFIYQRARRAFAVAVFCQLNTIRAMRWFKANNLGDDDLPIREHTDQWKTSWQSEFYDEHWRFFAPTFSTTQRSHNLEDAHILPFVARAVEYGRGSFGVVTQYSVHKNHMNTVSVQQSINKYGRKWLTRSIEQVSLEDMAFAVKEIQATEDTQADAEHWEKEVKALGMMNELNEKHIVRFITAFRRRMEHGEEHYLMFEWADRGNLRSLWRDAPRPVLSGTLVKDAVKQILGLAKALEAAHNLNTTGASYRHGDLKPENILVFSGGGCIGTLKIGDWGEAKEHEQVTEMRRSRTTAEYGTRRYEAPEVVTGVQAKWLGQSTGRRSRLYDIWAMGCITLEFIIWLMYGLDELNRFNRELGEGFYQISVVNGKKVARVHELAVSWMDQMMQDPRCQVGNTAIGDLLELVKNALLVVKLPRRLGTNLSDIGKRSTLSSLPARPDLEGNLVMEVVLPQAQRPGFQPPSDVPSFILTPAEAEPIRVPVQPVPETEGPARCLATEFRNLVEGIEAEDENESYWHILDWGQRSPASTSSPIYSRIPVRTGPRSSERFRSAGTSTAGTSLFVPTPRKVLAVPTS